MSDFETCAIGTMKKLEEMERKIKLYEKELIACYKELGIEEELSEIGIYNEQSNKD